MNLFSYMLIGALIGHFIMRWRRYRFLRILLAPFCHRFLTNCPRCGDLFTGLDQEFGQTFEVTQQIGDSLRVSSSKLLCAK